MNSTAKPLVWLILIVVAMIAAYALLTMPDQRTSGQRVGDAIDAFHDKGPDAAVKQLEQRTPGERLGDAIKDNTKEPREHYGRPVSRGGDT